MSGTSWFDLSSIQEQINKSLQEAAKIADDASKYDILNFDEMAKREEEEEDEDCEGDDEHYQEQASTHYEETSYNRNSRPLNIGRKAPNEKFDLVNTEPNIHRIQGLANASSDHRSFPTKSQPIIEGTKKAALLSPVQLRFKTAQESAVASISSRASDRRNEYSGVENDTVYDARAEASSFPLTTPLPDDSCPQFHTKTSDASFTLSTNGYVTPPLSSRAFEEVNLDGGTSDQSMLLIPESQKNFTDTQVVGVTTHVGTPRFDEEVAGDDFFGNQFNSISTIKKEKLRSSSSAPSDAVLMSIAMPLRAGPLSPQTADNQPRHYNSANNFRSSSKSQCLELITNEVRKEKKKTRKKTNKGGLDFFGMGSADSGVVQIQSSSLPMHSSSASEPNSSGFSFFEPVGMLNEDSDKCCLQSATAVQSSIRPLLRLPGITFADVATRGDMNDSTSVRPSTGSSITKTLFSFFDNVEDEIDSSEDPILRQVELNKSNPGPRVRPHNLSSMFFYSPASAGNQEDGDDLESHSRTSSTVGGRGRISVDAMGGTLSGGADSAGEPIRSNVQTIFSLVRDREVSWLCSRFIALVHRT